MFGTDPFGARDANYAASHNQRNLFQTNIPHNQIAFHGLCGNFAPFDRPIDTPAPRSIYISVQFAIATCAPHCPIRIVNDRMLQTVHCTYHKQYHHRRFSHR